MKNTHFYADTVRGRFLISNRFKSGTEAEKNGYHFYFSNGTLNSIYMKQTGLYHAKFALVPSRQYEWEPKEAEKPKNKEGKS